MLKIAVLASGEGTNLQALIDSTENKSIPGKIVLVLSNKEDAGALKRAERAGIPFQAVRPSDFSTPEAFDAFLAEECRKANVELVCLAGYLRKLRAPMLDAFQNRILNIHPALLPAFGGKGMYGMKVHESVLESGAKVSGCTVHYADDAYDHGPILLQSTVHVLPNDTVESLATRVRQQEHWLFPEAVKLVAENRVKIDGRKITITSSPHEGSPRIRRALLSLSDKEGIVEFARELEELGVEIISTSGTARKLIEAGVRVRSLDSLTGFPEILDGRVKTLHPKVHGGILLRRNDPRQVEEARVFGLESIDLVAVNLYPFERVAAGASSPYSREVIENIDIGGVTLIRAAAKNFEDVAVIVDPSDYRAVLDELAGDSGRLNLETRRKLALKAIEHTARYDAMISDAWRSAEAQEERFPATIKIGLKRIQTLRYGENPHQNAALYVREEKGVANFEQLHGKELSYNNLLDTFGTWDAVNEFETPTVVLFKHVTPSGIGTDEDLNKAFEMAWASDPLSAFGGILAVNRPFPLSIAEGLGKRFVEVIVAPSFDEDALEKLKKKKNLRLIV
ncbi:MAG: phosphoribosylaminoimidazolecarboxamide formyltransferase, partial [Elusimicrobia bacterium]